MLAKEELRNFSQDEIDSLVASVQAEVGIDSLDDTGVVLDALSVKLDYFPRFDADEWLETFGTHVLLVRKLRIGACVVRHVGQCKGDCPTSERLFRVDCQVAATLRRQVRCGGLIWVLRAGKDNDPEYHSVLGVVSRIPWFDRSSDQRPWKLFPERFGYCCDSKRGYRNHKEAMRALIAFHMRKYRRDLAEESKDSVRDAKAKETERGIH